MFTCTSWFRPKYSPKGFHTLSLVVSHIPDLIMRGSHVMCCVCVCVCVSLAKHLDDILAGCEDQSCVRAVLDASHIAEMLLTTIQCE